MNNKFDAIVIGSGPGGLAAAYGLAEKGRSVAVVEAFKWGGTCPNYGCDPTKIMMAAVETKHRASQMQTAGITGDLSLNWPDLKARKDAYSNPVSENTKEGLVQSKIITLTGTASFRSDASLQVGDEIYQADKYIIATGQRPRIPDIAGKEYLKTSNDFLDLDVLPQKIVFLGAGYVSLELAQIARAAGSQVTVITHGALGLRGFDGDLSQSFFDQLRSDGIEFIENIEIQTLVKEGETYSLTDGKGFELNADYVIAGTGRIPNLEKLGLEQLGVQTTPRGLVMNDYLQTSHPNIYGLGDVLDKEEAKLTLVAGYEGRYLVDNLYAEKPEKISYPLIPTLVFGAVKLAQVGQMSGANLEIKDLALSNWYTYKRVVDSNPRVRIAFDKTSGQVVGAAMLSSLADEWINLMGIFIQQKVDLKKFQSMLMAYPTVASDFFYFL